ncbi:MAG TPA: hypothetical protein VHO43_09565 [Ignavibacteriales bacterium]|nr:hypothetical protein [Ignavibacteriales bacterium]
MNDIEKKKYGMYEDVLNLLTRNIDLSLGLGPAAFLMTRLRRVMDEIEQTDKDTSSIVLDAAAENAAGRDGLLADLAAVSSALFNFSRQSGNVELRDRTRYNQSYLMRLSDLELLNKAEALRMLALKYVAEIRRMGITPNTIHNLGLKIEYFRRSLEKRVLSSGAVLENRQMSELFSIADGILESTDKLIDPLSGDFEEFYEKYVYLRDFENQDGRKALWGLEEDERANN